MLFSNWFFGLEHLLRSAFAAVYFDKQQAAQEIFGNKSVFIVDEVLGKHDFADFTPLKSTKKAP